MLKLGRLTGLIALLLASSGCFEIEQSYTLKRDLSGTAEVRVSADFEAFARAQAFRAHSAEGKKGDPTAKDIEGAIAEISGSIDVLADPGYQELMQGEARKRLPEGIELLDYTVSREARRVKMLLGFAFDDVHKVSSIKLAQTPAQQESGSKPSESPFAGFRVKDEGKTLLVFVMSEGTDPIATFSGQVPGTGAEGARKEETVAPTLDRYSIRIEAPFEVVDSNATRREGKTLHWDYDAETIAKTPPAVQAKGMWVRYRK